MKNTTVPFPRATPGTTHAINSPPQDLSEGKLKALPPPGGGQLTEGDRSDRTYNWRSCSQEARLVLEAMRRATPRGAAQPWRSSPSVTPIQRLLDDGCDLDDLLELVQGAAELVTTGRQEARWWYPANLFGAKTIERWLADVAALRACQDAAASRAAELQAIEERAERRRQESLAAPAPRVQNLALHRMATEAMELFRAGPCPTLDTRNRTQPSAERVVGSLDGAPAPRQDLDRPPDARRGCASS